jgi:hypothetical protein
MQEARLAHGQQWKGRHSSRYQPRAVQDGRTAPGIREGRVDKRVTSVGATTEQIAQLRLRS